MTAIIGKATLEAVITEAAIEAALGALNRSRGLNLDTQARLALEAAVPHLVKP